jgi:hypothetical protein
MNPVGQRIDQSCSELVEQRWRQSFFGWGHVRRLPSFSAPAILHMPLSVSTVYDFLDNIQLCDLIVNKGALMAVRVRDTSVLHNFIEQRAAKGVVGARCRLQNDLTVTEGKERIPCSVLRRAEHGTDPRRRCLIQP